MKISFFEKFYNWKYSSDINDELKNIKKLSSYDRDEFLQWQEAAKWKIAEHHFYNNNFYHTTTGDTLPSSWNDLPIMTRDIYQNNKVLDNSSTESLYINTTSGTTGAPLKFAKDYKTQARVWAAKKRFFNLHGISTGSKEARFYAMPKGCKNILIENIKDIILNRTRFNVFDMSEIIFDEWIKRFKKKDFEYAYGFTSAIVLFSRYLLEKSICLKQICPSIKVCIVTSEICTHEDKKIIEEAFGIKVVIEYGSKDVGLIGYECEEGNLHIPEENVYIELNDDNEILVTDLSNTAFPFIRYLLGDKVTISNNTCQCGSHNRIIETLDGRSNELIILPNNRSIPSLVFLIIMRTELENLGNLKEFVVHQTKKDSFVLNIATDIVISEVQKGHLHEVAKNYLQTEIKLMINQVDSIEREPSGKLKFFYSELESLL